MNEELTAIHREVIDNLESIHGALLRAICCGFNLYKYHLKKKKALLAA